MSLPPEINQACLVDTPDVRLTVIIGEGQLGLVSVYLDGVLVVRVPGSIGQLLLGPGIALRNRVLHVRTIVNDVLSLTNRMSVSYLVAGVLSPCSVTHEGEVDAEGEQLTFTAHFRFM